MHDRFIDCYNKRHIPPDEIHIAEEGFDPSTFGLWAQHASAAPLRCESEIYELLYDLI